jgi:uncharacterized membrane protein
MLKKSKELAQYVHYVMVSWDKRWGFAWAGLGRSKAIIIMFAVETLLLSDLYFAVALTGLVSDKFRLSTFVIVAYVLVIITGNNLLLGSGDGVEFFKIFDKWSRWKRIRWNIGLFSIAAVA